MAKKVFVFGGIVLVIFLLIYFGRFAVAEETTTKYVADEELVGEETQCGTGYVEEKIFSDANDKKIRFCVKREEYADNRDYVKKSFFQRDSGADIGCSEGATKRGSFGEVNNNKNLCVSKATFPAGQDRIVKDVKVQEICPRGYEISFADFGSNRKIFHCVLYSENPSAGGGSESTESGEPPADICRQQDWETKLRAYTRCLDSATAKVYNCNEDMNVESNLDHCDQRGKTCSNGECVTGAGSISGPCTDTDPNNDIDTKGSVTVSGTQPSNYLDKCEGGKLVQVDCNSSAPQNYSWLASVDCPAGEICKDYTNGAKCELAVTAGTSETGGGTEGTSEETGERVCTRGTYNVPFFDLKNANELCKINKGEDWECDWNAKRPECTGFLSYLNPLQCLFRAIDCNSKFAMGSVTATCCQTSSLEGSTGSEQNCELIGLPSTVISAKTGAEVCSVQGKTCVEYPSDESVSCSKNGGFFGCHNCVRCCTSGAGGTSGGTGGSTDSGEEIKALNEKASLSKSYGESAVEYLKTVNPGMAINLQFRYVHETDAYILGTDFQEPFLTYLKENNLGMARNVYNDMKNNLCTPQRQPSCIDPQITGDGSFSGSAAISKWLGDSTILMINTSDPGLAKNFYNYYNDTKQLYILLPDFQRSMITSMSSENIGRAIEIIKDMESRQCSKNAC